jgi:general secretion pathway protein J
LTDTVHQSTSPRARRRGEEGFTLLELLVALSILALLLPLLFAGLRTGTLAWSHTAVSSTDTMMAAQAFLRRQIEAAYPAHIFDQAGGPGRTDFDGQATALEFLTPAPERNGSFARLHLTTARSSDRLNLTARWRLDLPAALISARTETESVLVENIATLELAYFGTLEADVGEPPRWHGAWIDPTMPRLVRIRVKFPAGDNRYWPDLVVAPRIGVDTECVFDPVGLGCRGRS